MSQVSSLRSQVSWTALWGCSLNVFVFVFFIVFVFVIVFFNVSSSLQSNVSKVIFLWDPSLREFSVWGRWEGRLDSSEKILFAVLDSMWKNGGPFEEKDLKIVPGNHSVCSAHSDPTSQFSMYSLLFGIIWVLHCRLLPSFVFLDQTYCVSARLQCQANALPRDIGASLLNPPIPIYAGYKQAIPDWIQTSNFLIWNKQA